MGGYGYDVLVCWVGIRYGYIPTIPAGYFLGVRYGCLVGCRVLAPTAPKDGKLERKKVIPVQLKGYIKPSSMNSLIHYFYVKKGLLYDIMMVYNDTGYGLNAII